jgi:hypothetical protein
MEQNIAEKHPKTAKNKHIHMNRSTEKKKCPSRRGSIKEIKETHPSAVQRRKIGLRFRVNEAVLIEKNFAFFKNTYNK